MGNHPGNEADSELSKFPMYPRSSSIEEYYKGTDKASLSLFTKISSALLILHVTATLLLGSGIIDINNATSYTDLTEFYFQANTINMFISLAIVIIAVIGLFEATNKTILKVVLWVASLRCLYYGALMVVSSIGAFFFSSLEKL